MSEISIRTDNKSWTAGVVRVRTSTWRSGVQIFRTKSVSLLKRLSGEDPYLAHDLDAVGEELVLKAIKNLDEVEDGIYSLITTDVKCDWETGYVDDYKYKLVPYQAP